MQAAAQEARRADTGLRFEQAMRSALEKAEGIELRGQDPEAFEAQAHDLIPEGAREAWFDIDARFASDVLHPSHDNRPAGKQQEGLISLESSPELQEALGVTPEDIAKARQSGATSLPVKTARILSRLNGEQFTALEGALRPAPDGVTISEAKAFDPIERARQANERIERHYSENAEVYLDGMSRDKGEGSHNFVIFDDAAIDVLQTYYQPRARGAVDLTPERAAIRLFKDADLSTIPHESAHIFLDSLMRVVADDGGRCCRRTADVCSAFGLGRAGVAWCCWA